MIRIMQLKNWREGVLQIFSIGFILLFTYTAVNKLQEIDVFQTQLEQFPFIGEFAEWIVLVLPVMLITVSVLFFFHRTRLIALCCSLILMLLFTFYILAVLNFAESLPCSCAGVFNSWSWTEHLYFNIGILLLALLGLTLSYDLRLKKEEPRAKLIDIHP